MNRHLGTLAAICGVWLSLSGCRCGKPEPVRGAPEPGGSAQPHGAPHPGASGEAPEDAMHHGVMSENARLVVAYPITMPRLQSYVAAVKEIRAAGTRDPSLMAKLREPGPRGEQPAGMGARLDAIAPLKDILQRHGLAGIDLVLMPQAVTAGRIGYSLEQEGRPLPPDQVNAGAVALYRADLRRMDEITKAFMADLRYINGP